MAKTPQRFLDIDVSQLPYGETEEPLRDVLAAGFTGGPIAGMWLTYKNTRTITVQPGSIVVAGQPAILAAPQDVDIYYDFGDAGSPVANTVYFVYATVENGVLNFYFSAASPIVPGVTITTLQPDHRCAVMRHPTYATWRYIGQVLYRSAGNILPFTVCTPQYWEGAWTSATRNVDMTLEHGWGAIPQDARFLFSTTVTGDSNVLTTITYDPVSTKRYGVLPKVVSDKAITLDVQKDALFWINSTAAWANSGYIKVAVRR